MMRRTEVKRRMGADVPQGRRPLGLCLCVCFFLLLYAISQRTAGDAFVALEQSIGWPLLDCPSAGHQGHRGAVGSESASRFILTQKGSFWLEVLQQFLNPSSMENV